MKPDVIMYDFVGLSPSDTLSRTSGERERCRSTQPTN